MKYFVIIFTLFFSLFFLSSNNDAYGLSCEQPDMKRHFAESDVVFSGKAISQEYFPSEYGFANGRNDTKTQFQVIESFKGDNKKIMNVTSSEWFWGYDFNKGLEYVVFAYYDDNNDLRHQTCTSTSLLKDADIVKIRQASSFAESFSITEKQVRYNIPYKITNGIIDDVTLSCDDGSLLLQVTAQDESDVTLILDLPRNILDPKINGRDDRFIVLGDGQEIDYEEMPYTKHRKLSMSFSSDTNEIEIIHSFIPELKPKMCEVVHDPPYSYMLPPLIQFNSEIPFNEIQCKQNLVLIQKYDGSPACVTESTKQKLIERGWTSSSTTVIIYSSFEQDHDRTYTNPRNAVIDLEKNNSVTWVNNADYAVQVYDYENKSWSTGQIEPSMRDSIQFNNTSYYEFAVESANDRHFGEIIVISDDTNPLPIETRMKMGMSIVSNDLGNNPALIGVGTGDVNDGIVIDINQKELEKRDDAKSYYYDMYKEMIPFDVPITIEFSEPFKLLE